MKDADLFILDEPNAAMDSITEYETSKLYEELLETKMGIIVAHRFNNLVKMMDIILVLSDGSIVERGTHEELASRDGLYSKLYNLK